MDFTSATGSLLASAPDMLDPNFMHTVVMVCDHSPEGAFGLVLNRDAGVTLDKLLPEHPVLGSLRIGVNAGGPVGLDTLQFLHRRPEEIPGGIEVCDGVFLGGALEDLASLSQIRPDVVQTDVRMFLGYAGWGEGQLDAELNSGSWLPARAKAEFIFSSDPERDWRRVLRSLGSDGQGLEDLPPDISWN